MKMKEVNCIIQDGITYCEKIKDVPPEIAFLFLVCIAIGVFNSVKSNFYGGEWLSSAIFGAIFGAFFAVLVIFIFLLIVTILKGF